MLFYSISSSFRTELLPVNLNYVCVITIVIIITLGMDILIGPSWKEKLKPLSVQLHGVAKVDKKH